MKSRAKGEVKGRTKERLRNPMTDPTLEGKDESKVGRIQEKIGPLDWEALLTGIFRGKTVVECGTDRNIFRQGQPAESSHRLHSPARSPSTQH